MQLSKEESTSLYLVKAIGITSVVFGHYVGFIKILNPYYFHIPLFFFIGGITLKDTFNVRHLLKSIGSLLSYLVTRYIIIGWLSILLIYIGFTSLSDPFGNGIIDSIIKAYAGNMHNNQLFLVAWFLVAYIFALVICTIVVFLSKSLPATDFSKTSLLIFLSMLSGFLALNFFSAEYQESHKQIYNLIAQSMYGSMFMLIGYLGRKFVFRAHSLSALLLSITLTTVITVVYKTTPMTMSWSEYKDGFFISTLIALLIIYCIFILSNAYAKFINEKSIIILIGKCTKSIMTWHLSVFILIDLIFSITVKSRPLASLGPFEHFHNKFSIATYTLAGVLIPALLVKLNVIEKFKVIYQKVSQRWWTEHR